MSGECAVPADVQNALIFLLSMIVGALVVRLGMRS